MVRILCYGNQVYVKNGKTKNQKNNKKNIKKLSLYDHILSTVIKLQNLKYQHNNPTRILRDDELSALNIRLFCERKNVKDRQTEGRNRITIIYTNSLLEVWLYYALIFIQNMCIYTSESFFSQKSLKLIICIAKKLH